MSGMSWAFAAAPTSLGHHLSERVSPKNDGGFYPHEQPEHLRTPGCLGYINK